MWNNFADYYGDGMAFFPDPTETFNSIDKRFLGFVKGYTTLNVKIPSLISEEVLEKCGYFNTFPQHLTQLKAYSGNSLREKKRYLTPAACIHIYPLLKKEDKQNVCYTTLERVYRYEAGNFTDKERLWEFTVREFVFVGNVEFVKGALEDLKQKSLVVAKEINCDAILSEAYDSFLPSRENLIRQKLQMANHLKDELLLPFEDRKIAVASFNYHGNHFSKPFGFDKQGEIVTGCVGFGMERWMLCIDEKQRHQK